MKTALYHRLRELVFFCVSCIARILPELKPYKSELVLPARTSPVTLPVNFDRLPEKFAKRFFLSKKINARYVHSFRNVYVNGDAVIFRNLRVYSPSLAWQPYLKWYKSGRFLFRQWLFKLKEVNSVQNVALVYNQWGYENYYHWMIESLPRLLLIQKNHPDSLIIIPDPTPEFVRATVGLLGFKKLISLPIKEMEILKVNHLVMPNLEFEKAGGYAEPGRNDQTTTILNADKSLPPKHCDEELIISVKKQILSHFPSRTANRKIFVSRSRQKFRRLTNENDLEPVLLKYGFETVYFEELSFNKQVELMQETEILLSTHGANLVNLIFLPFPAIVIEMVNIDFTNDVYYTLASDMHVSYYAVPCTMVDKTLIPPEDVLILNDTVNFTDQMVALNNAHLQVNVSLVEETIESALKLLSHKRYLVNNG